MSPPTPAPAARRPYGPALLAALLLAALSGAAPLVAQEPTDPSEAEREVVEVLVRFFDGMRAGDTTAMGATLHPGARLVTTGADQAGAPFARITDMSRFLEAIAGAEGRLDERLYATEVRVDGNLAAVWTEYDLFHDGALSHCGVDAFQLVRTADGWRIIQIADTRRLERCRGSAPGEN